MRCGETRRSTATALTESRITAVVHIDDKIKMPHSTSTSTKLNGATLADSFKGLSITSTANGATHPDNLDDPTALLADRLQGLAIAAVPVLNEKKSMKKKKRTSALSDGGVALQPAKLDSPKDSKLDSLQSLCEEVGIDPAPCTITQCKKVRSLPAPLFFVHSTCSSLT